MEYDFYEVVKAVVKKVSMVNPGRSNLSHNKVYASQQEAGFEDIICGWVDAQEIIKSIKNVNKIKLIILLAVGYEEWEIEQILKKSRWTIWRYKKDLINFCNIWRR